MMGNALPIARGPSACAEAGVRRGGWSIIARVRAAQGSGEAV